MYAYLYFSLLFRFFSWSQFLEYFLLVVASNRVIALSELHRNKKCKLRKDQHTRFSSSFLMLYSVLVAYKRNVFDDNFFDTPSITKNAKVTNPFIDPFDTDEFSSVFSNNDI